MRTLTLTLCIALCTMTQGFSQLSVGLKAGTAPDVNPGTHHVIVNKANPSDLMLFNIKHVSHGEQFGLVLRYDEKLWWFGVELMYATSSAKYSMNHIYCDPDLQVESATERRSFLDVPVSAGVQLGIVDIFSGFTLTRQLTMKSQLHHISGYDSQLPVWSAGWHLGIGISAQHLTFDIRYQQTFENYGQNRYINGQELMLHNAPGRLVMLVGFRL
jgi:hypothetical protein